MKHKKHLAAQVDIAVLSDEIIKLGPQIAKAIMAMLKPKN